MDIKSITRSAAIVYADNMSNRTTNTIKRKFVESVYVNNGNVLLTLAELVNKVEEEMGLSFSEDELKPIVKDETIFEAYFSTQEENSISLTKKEFKDLIYRYLHSVLNTNISTYIHFINPTQATIIPKLNSEPFEDEEIELINGFVKWDNETKNKAIFKLINYCIEYAIVVNNSSEDVLSKSLRTKVFYLDNALLYRALGINGEVRKKRTLSF